MCVNCFKYKSLYENIAEKFGGMEYLYKHTHTHTHNSFLNKLNRHYTLWYNVLKISVYQTAIAV